MKDVEEFLPSQKILGGGLAERWQENCPNSGKVRVRGLNWEKKIEEYPGLS